MALPQLRPIWSYLRQVKSWLFLQVALDISAGLLAAALPIFIAVVYSRILGFESLRGTMFLPPGSSTRFLLLFLLGLISTQLLLVYFRMRVKIRLLEGLTDDLRTQLFNWQIGLDPEVYASGGTSRFLLRFSGDLSSIRRLVDKGMLELLSDLILIASALTIAGWISWIVMLSWLLIWLLAGWGQFYLNRRIKVLESDRRSRQSSLLSMVSRAMQSVKTIHVWNQRQTISRRFASKSARLKTIGTTQSHFSGLQEALAWTGGYAPLLVTLVVLMNLPKADSRDLPLWLGLMVLVLAMRPVMRRILRAPGVWTKGLISLRKFNGMQDQPAVNERKGNDLEFHPKSVLKLKISDEGSWMLPQGCKGLADLTKLPEAESLFNLLARLKKVPQGSIFLGEVDLSKVSAREVRKNFGFFSADFPLYGRTLLEALSPGREEKTRVETQFKVWQKRMPVLQQLDLEMAIKEVHLQFNPVQQELLQLFRLALSGKKVWVLARPFTALDGPNAQAAAELFSLEWKNKTIIVFSQHADYVEHLFNETQWSRAEEVILSKNN